MARVARAHGLNANVVFHWRREHRERKSARRGSVPVATGDVASETMPSSASASSIRAIDLPGGAVVSVEWRPISSSSVPLSRVCGRDGISR